MTTRPLTPVGAWPPLMRAVTAAAYVDEKSVEAFLRRAGTVYPAGRKISGRGRVWVREELDKAIMALQDRQRLTSLVDDL